MCGISGVINFKSSFSKSLFLETSQLIHANRGPENFNFWQTEQILLTHSRLKIIDLSDQANQPMTSLSGHSIIVFNGEIYNYKAIAKTLDIQPKTKSDTEIVLESIEQWGIEKTLQNLKGMFAFCYIDLRLKKIHLARDRFGQKPLYYHHQNGTFMFASDIRVITKVNRQSLSLNHDSIAYFLSELSSPQPHTIWNEVKQLEPAHCLTLDFESKIISKTKYWSMPLVKNHLANENEILEEVENKLKDAILSRAESDVPTGCFLSGGVDSGLIVSMLAQKSSQRIKTYTVGFDYDGFNELKDAHLISNRYETDHTELKIDVSIKDDIETILDAFGEPFADSSAIPSYYISKEIRKSVTVALSGDGGDEFFGGYLDYGQSYTAEKFNEQYPKLLQQSIAQMSKIGSRISKKIKNYGTEINYLAIKDPFKLSRGMGFSPNQNKFLLEQNTFVEAYFNKLWQVQNANESDTTNLMLSSLNTRLLNDYLVKVDRSSMANSLEVRSPFMDHELAELAFSIPNSLKFKDNHSKYLLKRLGQKHMYQDVFDKPKRGFGIPIKHWLKNELYNFADTHIKELAHRKLVVNKNVINLLPEHKKGNFDHTHKIWALICLEIWLKNNFD